MFVVTMKNACNWQNTQWVLIAEKTSLFEYNGYSFFSIWCTLNIFAFVTWIIDIWQIDVYTLPHCIDLHCTLSFYTEHALSRVYKQLSQGDLIKIHLAQYFWQLAIWHRGAYQKDVFTNVLAVFGMKNPEIWKWELTDVQTCKHINIFTQWVLLTRITGSDGLAKQ